MYETPAVFRGNLGADPDVKKTANGVAVARLRVASDGPGKDKEAVWIDVQVWRELAERSAAVLKKGSPVVGIGAWEQQTFQAEDGEKRTRRFVSAWALGPDLSRASIEGTVQRPTPPRAADTAEADPFNE